MKNSLSSCSANLDSKAVISEHRLDAVLPPQVANRKHGLPFVTRDNLRAAMRENGGTHSLLLAAFELRHDGCMPDEHVVSLAEERANQGGTVTDIDVHAGQCAGGLRQESHIRNIEYRSAAMFHPVSDRGRAQGVFDRKRFECQLSDYEPGVKRN